MPVYLDHNATTRVDPRVLDAMMPYLTGPYGNASSLHRFGRAARDGVERAREQLAALVNCRPGDIVWTSGGTESNNLAIKGAAVAAGNKRRVLYGATEHPAVMETAEALVFAGYAVEAIAVDESGCVGWDAFADQLQAGPVSVVSLMRANNETGVIQDIPRAAQMAHQVNAWLHVDAVQAAGKIPLDFRALDADLMSLSSHKLYGPKGVGALVRRGEVDLFPLHHGGPQEKGLRGGTENVAAIVGFGAAAELAMQVLETRMSRLQLLRQRLEAGLRAMQGVRIFGEAAEQRLPNTVQFAVPAYEGEALLMQLDRRGYGVSSGSACASGKGEPSHVLLAMDIPREIAMGAIRVSLGEGNSEADVDGLLATLQELQRR